MRERRDLLQTIHGPFNEFFFWVTFKLFVRGKGGGGGGNREVLNTINCIRHITL